MSYFREFPKEIYRFVNGNTALMQNLSLYVDIVDQVKENSSFYKNYYIRDGERPDNVSHRLYENPRLHWTFYIMNDHIREHGWPLTQTSIIEKAQEDFPNITLNTQDDIDMFSKVTTVVSQSGAKGNLVRIDTSLGQVVIDPIDDSEFLVDDTISDFDGIVAQTATVLSVENEYLSAHHYVDNEGNITDYRTKDGWNTGLFEMTNLEYYQKQNEDLRQIRVIKPSSIATVTSMFGRAVNS